MGLWLAWSGGKDAALALRAIGPDRVTGLLSTVDETSDRVPIHGVPSRLLAAQAGALGLELHLVPLPSPCPNPTYRARLRSAVEARGIEALAFGDLHLEDIRTWRVETLFAMGVEARFPLFGREPAALAREALEAGLRARVCAIDRDRLDPALLGRWYDQALLADLPPGCDPMGENGELHTFAHGLDGQVWVDEAPLPGFEALDDRHLVLRWSS